MLQQFLVSKQEQLDSMLKRKAQLENTLKTEHSRCEQLEEYKQWLNATHTKTNSLMLNNSADLVVIVTKMQEEQDQKLEQAQSDFSRHEQACRHQACFNLGIEKLVDKRQQEVLAQQIREDLKIADEHATQMFGKILRLNSTMPSGN